MPYCRVAVHGESMWNSDISFLQLMPSVSYLHGQWSNSFKDELNLIRQLMNYGSGKNEKYNLHIGSSCTIRRQYRNVQAI